MAKDKVKKGFFFYFGFFLMIILSVFLVLFVVMLFMPGKNILGLQYFTNSSTALVQKTTNNGTEINFDNPNFSEINIENTYGQILVQKNHSYDKNGIYIVNNSKGFVTTKKAQPFSYSVSLDGGILNIVVKEQPGFIYFSKDVKIIVQISNENINPLSGKKINIKTQGPVNIGGAVMIGHSFDFDLASLKIEGGKGDIILAPHSPSSFSELSIKATSGHINISADAVSATVMNLETTSGSIKANTLTSQNDLNLTTSKGRVQIGTINANVKPKCTDAYLEIGTIVGNLDFVNSAQTFSSSVVKVGLITGDLSAKGAKNTTFEIGEVVHVTEIETTTGNIKVGNIAEKKGIKSSSRVKSTSGNIDVTLSENSANVEILTEKGHMNVTVPKNVSSGINLRSDSGDIVVSLENGGSYSLSFAYTSGDSPFDMNKVNLNKDVEKTNPTVFGNGGGKLNFVCNKNVTVNWR